MKAALTPAERQARSRAKRAAIGGQTITVALSPEAADKLAAWNARGLSQAEILNKLLTRSKP